MNENRKINAMIRGNQINLPHADCVISVSDSFNNVEGFFFDSNSKDLEIFNINKNQLHRVVYIERLDIYREKQIKKLLE